MKKIYALFLICFSALVVYGQSEANHWYFGEFAGLSFQSGDPVVQTNGVLDTWEGCSSISTSSGTLRFYTDGIRVYNRNHQIMPNGNGLLGDPSSSQSGIIVPHPGNNQYYYIFSNDNEDASGGVNGLNYSLVNMNLDNWLGDVVSTEKNVNLTAPLCEKVTAVGHSNGVDTWVITHKWGTNDFYVFKVTTDGVELTPVISSAGIVVGGPGTSQHDPKGYMKVSPDGSTIAKANAGLRSVEIFDFDNTTGVVNNALIDNSLGGEPYGVEFSPNNNFLYINTWKTKPSRVLYQYDLKDDDVIGSRVQIASGANGALQLAPDNRIYVAMAQTGYLSRINQPNKAGSACNYQASAVYLDGRQSMWGLPNFILWDCDTTVGINQVQNNGSLQMTIFPNPVFEGFNISFEEVARANCLLTIYNLYGMKTNEIIITVGEEFVKLDASNWQNGLYLAVVRRQGQVVGKSKFVKK